MHVIGKKHFHLSNLSIIWTDCMSQCLDYERTTVPQTTETLSLAPQVLSTWLCSDCTGSKATSPDHCLCVVLSLRVWYLQFVPSSTHYRRLPAPWWRASVAIVNAICWTSHEGEATPSYDSRSTKHLKLTVTLIYKKMWAQKCFDLKC